MFLVIIVFLIAVMVGTTAFLEGIERGEGMIKKQAVERGHARFVADEEGNVKFEWVINENTR